MTTRLSGGLHERLGGYCCDKIQCCRVSPSSVRHLYDRVASTTEDPSLRRGEVSPFFRCSFFFSCFFLTTVYTGLSANSKALSYGNFSRSVPLYERWRGVSSERGATKHACVATPVRGHRQTEQGHGQVLGGSFPSGLLLRSY